MPFFPSCRMWDQSFGVLLGCSAFQNEKVKYFPFQFHLALGKISHKLCCYKTSVLMDLSAHNFCDPESGTLRVPERSQKLESPQDHVLRKIQDVHY